MKDDINQQILKELKKLNSLSIWISVSFALIPYYPHLCPLVYKYKAKQKTNYDTPIWTQINNAKRSLIMKKKYV